MNGNHAAIRQIDGVLWSPMNDPQAALALQMDRPQNKEQQVVDQVQSSTGSSIFSSLPSAAADKKNAVVCKLLKEAIPSQEKLNQALEHNRLWWKAVTKNLKGPGGTPDEFTDISVYTKWALSQGRPYDVAKVIHFLVPVLDDDNAVEKVIDLIDQLIIHDDEYFGTLGGVEVGLMQARLFSEVGQLRRAWLTTRRALDMAQLMGLHRTRTNLRQDIVFWGLFQLDRFTSITLHTPYHLSDIHCNLTFKGKELPIVQESTGFLTRLAILGGKVIDRSHSTKDSTFASLLAIDQELTRLSGHMPQEYWELEKYAPKDFPGERRWTERAMGQLMYYQTRMVLHLPYLLRSITNASFEYSREACISTARSILRQYHIMRDPANLHAYRFKTMDFASIIAAAVIVIGLVGSNSHGGNPPPGPSPLLASSPTSTPSPATAGGAPTGGSVSSSSGAPSAYDAARQAALDAQDWALLDRTLATYTAVATLPFGKICAQSRKVLERLVAWRDGAPADPDGRPQRTRIVIPFFGTITVARGQFHRTAAAAQAAAQQAQQQQAQQHQQQQAHHQMQQQQQVHHQGFRHHAHAHSTSAADHFPSPVSPLHHQDPNLLGGQNVPRHHVQQPLDQHGAAGYAMMQEPQIAYDGVYMPASPYIQHEQAAALAQCPGGGQAAGWHDVGGFDLDQDWNWMLGANELL
jgi:hypothetical protein